MKKELDDLLKQALTPADEPNFWLNQRIINLVEEGDKIENRIFNLCAEKKRRKEEKNMDKIQKRVPAAALVAAVIGIGSITAYAGWKYLSTEKVAEKFGDQKLAEAFTGEDDVLINESQSFGGYNVTLLGIVSGKSLSQYERMSDGSVLDDRTYIVTALERADGTPMPDTSDDAYDIGAFFVSPLIEGYNPGLYNAVTMNGNSSEFAEDGILYRLTECDNIEIFADRGLYLCVNDGTFYNGDAYRYDEATGEITRNEGYEGLNALFDLPLDVSKANPQAAEKYLKGLGLD